MFELLNMAEMAADTYRSQCRLLGNYHVQDVVDIDNFAVRVYKRAKGSVCVVAFRGTDNVQDAVGADIGSIGLGLETNAFKLNDAVTFTQNIARKYPDCWLTGHSLGGAYVQLVGALLNLPGVTFNAPGVLHLLNAMSSNPFVKFAGRKGNPVSDFLSGGLGSLINRAAAGVGNDAFPPIANFRGNLDPVSKVGIHVGAPIQTFDVPSQLPHPHAMEPIIAHLKKRNKKST